MRAILWIIAIFALAAGVAMLAGANDGYLLVVLPPWRAQLSLNLAVVLVLLSFLALHLLLRLISKTLDLPGRVGALRSRRRLEKASRSMRDALAALFEGRFSESIKYARVAYASGGRSPVAALVAARAAHSLHDEGRYQEWMQRAADADEGRVAQLLTEAELAIADRRYEDAAVALETLRRREHRSTSSLRMSLEVATALGRWEQVPDLVRQLIANRAMSAEAARPLIRRAHLERLRALGGDAEQIAAYWRALSKEDLGDADLVEQALPLLAAAGQGAIARRTVERLLDSRWNSALARRYALCAGEGDEAKDALSRAEKWLSQHPDDPGLLYSLGRQCMASQIWGKAQSYLETSLKLQPAADTHFALAQLMEQIERPDEATAHYREAARFAAAVAQ